MGIIVRQSVKRSLVGFIGVGIGVLSTLFLYPEFDELYGLSQFLLGTATLFYPIASLGLVSAVVKFFPKFKTEDDVNKGMLSLILLAYLVLFSIFTIFYILFKNYIIFWLKDFGLDQYDLLNQYWYIILFLTALIILTNVVTYYAACYKRVVVPEILSNLFLKIYLPITILISFYFKFSDTSFAKCLIIYYIIVLVANFIYLKYLGVLKIKFPEWNFLSRKLKKEIFKYQIFSSYNNLGNVLAFRIDSVMIPMILSMGSNGLYSIMLFMSNVIEIPTRSLKSIATPIIAQAWENNDLSEIESIYKKTALNLIILGIGIMLLIWFSFDSITNISIDPDKLQKGKYTFLVLGIAKLVDMLTSINDHIIVYSPKYKYNLIFIFILSISNILLNFSLIQEYGILGAAIATAISYLLFNLTKLIFIFYHYRIHPFTTSILYVFMIGLLCSLFLYLMKDQFHFILQVIFNGFVILIAYFFVIYYYKISKDFTKLCDSVIITLRNYLS